MKWHYLLKKVLTFVHNLLYRMYHWVGYFFLSEELSEFYSRIYSRKIILAYYTCFFRLFVDFVLKSSLSGIFPLFSGFLRLTFNFLLWLDPLIPVCWTLFIETLFGRNFFIVDFLVEEEFFWYKGMNLSGVVIFLPKN